MQYQGGPCLALTSTVNLQEVRLVARTEPSHQKIPTLGSGRALDVVGQTAVTAKAAT